MIFPRPQLYPAPVGQEAETESAPADTCQPTQYTVHPAADM
jgi:hypothetical protein